MEIYEQIVDIFRQATHTRNDMIEESQVQSAEIIMRYSRETEQVMDIVIEEIYRYIQDNGDTMMDAWFAGVVLYIRSIPKMA